MTDRLGHCPRCAIMLLLPGLLLGTPSGATAQLPSPARDAAEELLEVVRSGDRARIRAFVETRFDAEAVEAYPLDEYHVPVLASLGRQVAGKEAMSVDLRGPMEVVILLAGPGGELELRVRVSGAPPHGIGYLGWGAPAPVIRAETLADLDRELRRLADEARFSGVVLLADATGVRFHEAYGWAERIAGVPNAPETRFDIGSLNKLFTTTAVLRLAEAGRLGLGDPIGAHVDGFRPDVAARVTILHLLAHRSGLDDYLTHPEFTTDPQRFRVPSDYLPLARDQAPAFEPGTARRYSNLGFAVLGAVIERVTGRDYHEAMDELVFTPAGMASAGPTAGADDARRYELQHGRFVSTDPLYPEVGSPAGGGFAAALDLYRFAHALLEHRLLNERNTALLLADFPSAQLHVEPEERIGFAGGAAGVSATILMDRVERRLVVIVANTTPFAESSIAQRMMELSW